MDRVDEIAQHLQALRRHAGSTDYASRVIDGCAWLLEEVERLRVEVADQRTRADSLALAYREEQGKNTTIQIEAERHRRIADEAVTRIESAENERAAVVAWLRETPTTRLWRQEPMDAAADAIERGEHRREEEP